MSHPDPRSPRTPPTTASPRPWRPSTRRRSPTTSRARIAGIRAGELGSLPIIVGIILIAIYFQSRNDNFLTAGNFVNLIAQMSPIAIIGMGIVFVLLLGEIDLSVGFVSGVGGVICALLLIPDGNEVSPAVAIAVAIAAGLVIGTIHGVLFAKVGIPSFVVTLAGLLAWNGVVLQLIGGRGTVVIQDDFVNGIANDYLSPGAALARRRGLRWRSTRRARRRRCAAATRPACRTSRCR